MDRKGGLAAAAILVAVLGISFMPRGGGESGGSSQAGAPRQRPLHTAPGTANKPEIKTGCTQIADRVGRFFSGKTLTPNRSLYPGECYDEQSGKDEPVVASEKLNFAIALLPNPVQTNLPLVFDRSIEVIQQAAQDEGYSYDSSWFPWTDEMTYERFDDEQKAEEWNSDLQHQPGVVTFRRNPTAGEPAYDGGLIVFVVGEQPTGGINDQQFENAMLWLRKLGGGPEIKQLRILGPTFSGSLPSLARELEKTKALAASGKGVHVYSGTANSNESIAWFRGELGQEPRCLPDDLFTFCTFLESDQLMTDRFLEFLEQSGYTLERVAILSEDETAFGSRAGGRRQITDKTGADKKSEGKCWKISNPQSKISCLENQPVYLYYPRDIAALRSAYAKQSIFSAGKPQSNTPSSSLRGDLGDAATSKHDTVRSYAGDLKPLSQEATLFSIINVLKAKRVQFVVIRSTNSLDQLFLSEFLRRSYSSGRVVLDGSDLLFRRGVEGEVMRGVMVLSTYPLLPWTPDVVRPVQQSGNSYTIYSDPSAQHSYRVFPLDLSEGTYIAARALFPEVNGNSTRVSDYGPPEWALTGSSDAEDDRKPPTWLSVVGHQQFWPVAVLNGYTLGKGRQFDTPDECQLQLLLPAGALPKPCQTSDVLSEALPQQDEAPQTQKASTGRAGQVKTGHRFPADTTFLMIFCWGLAVGHCYLCWRGCMIGTPHMRVYFAPIPLAEQPTLIFIGGLLLAALGITFAGATGLMEGFYTGHELYLWFAVGSMIGCGLVGFITNYSLPLFAKSRHQASVPAKRELVLIATAAAEGSAGETQESAVRAQQNSVGTVAGTNVVDETHVIRGSQGGSSSNVEGTPESLPKKLYSAANHLRSRLATRRIPVWLLAAIWVLLFACVLGIRLQLNSLLTLATRTSAFWRNSHIGNGVSGLLPQVLLILGLYAWFWYNLRGLSLFGEDRPVLPNEESLPQRFVGADNKPIFESQDDRRDKGMQHDPSGARLLSMFSSEQAGDRIEEAARPLSWSYVVAFVLILLATIALCWLVLGELGLQTLGERTFGIFIFFLMCVAIAVILSDALRLANAWERLRQLLVFLDRLRLRRTLARLKGLSWTSVLSMSGNVLEERYRLISRQLESARNLQTALAAWKPQNEVDRAHQEIAIRELGNCESAGFRFALRYTGALRKPSLRAVAKLKRSLAAYQQVMAKTAGCVLTHLILPAWQREGRSLILELEPAGKTDDRAESLPPLPGDEHVRAAEEFFVLPYLGFIQNTLGAMRTVIVGILLLFMATSLALASYPFNPRPAVGAIFLVVFVVVGTIVVFVYLSMHRDSTLSHITQSRPGELGFEFWIKIFSFGIGPLIGLLTALFPSISDFLVSWLQPSTEMMK